MSCHSIGMGLNEVVRMVITLYDKGDISMDTTKKLLATCSQAVYWCDGHEYEALDYIRRCRCGKCLRLIPKGERLYSLYDTYEMFHIFRDERLGSDGLCEECFDALIPKYCQDGETLQTVKDMIIKNYEDEPARYMSQGEPPKSNNGFEWARSVDWFD
ncbi:MAG: hypothetical protein J6P45_09275 [Lachnospiraceae bacterium]|nr:hypothetical protein [Lachnospiraceae bacterium]